MSQIIMDSVKSNVEMTERQYNNILDSVNSAKDVSEISQERFRLVKDKVWEVQDAIEQLLKEVNAAIDDPMGKEL